jgi:integrase
LTPVSGDWSSAPGQINLARPPVKTVKRLSDVFLRKLGPPPDGKPRKYADGDGLYAYLSPAGGVVFRRDYRFDGKRQTYTIGKYPAISLKEAREKVISINNKLENDINPIKKQIIKKQHTFAEVADEFIKQLEVKCSPGYIQDTTNRLNLYILPYIGQKAIDQITPQDLLIILKRLETQKKYDTAHRLYSICGQIFRFAVRNLKAPNDPTASIKGALAPNPRKHRAALTEPRDIRRLLVAIDGYSGAPQITAALKLAPLVFVRPGELRQAEWREIDLDAAEWRIPAEKMKMRSPHIVPLARQSLEIISKLRPITGDGKYLFPSLRTGIRPISDMTLTNALRLMGFSKVEMCAHGFRAMASTRLNELGYNPNWIERQLAHSEQNSVRAAYNHADYLQDRRKMMQEWADYLDSLKEDKN